MVNPYNLKARVQLGVLVKKDGGTVGNLINIFIDLLEASGYPLRELTAKDGALLLGAYKAAKELTEVDENWGYLPKDKG